MTTNVPDRKVWTQEEADLLLKIYNLYTNKELAEMFNCKVSAVNCKRSDLGVGIKQLEAEFNKDVPEGFRRCKVCEEILETESNYYLRNRKKPELGRGTICKECDNKNKAMKRREQKQEELNNLIKNCSCDLIVKHKDDSKSKKTHYCIRCKKDYNLK